MAREPFKYYEGKVQPKKNIASLGPHYRRTWLIDSGSAEDLVSRCNLTEKERANIVNCRSQRFSTANGVKAFDKKTTVHCQVDKGGLPRSG